ncbi:nodulation protein NfeD [Paenibacillaceae bacterium WGS1546]|uniref:NfeD family protein n=1 Tax=Cohnella sp. WGS1546 TaxID=3366810 RepID=UPI00372D4026
MDRAKVRGSGVGRYARIRMAALLALIALPLLSVVIGDSRAAAQTAGSVYVIPVHQTVESGLASFLERALTEAAEAKASLVILDVDTPGGRLDTAEDIGKLIRGSAVPTVAFVTGKAASAGAYLALNADQIAMAPNTVIGAAMIVDGAGNAVNNPKLISMWSEEMSAAAESKGRNPAIAVGMVDPNRVVELKEIGETKQKGEILSLSADKAFKVGYADKLAGTVEEVAEWKGLADRPIVEFNPSLAERVSAFVTGTGFSTLLLVIGIAGVVIELIVPGFGAPGIIGLLAFGLYFFGQSIAGFAGMEAMVLFLLGIGLLVAEIFVPSFGILGILGIAGLIAGITMGAYDTGNALRSLGNATLVAAVVVVIFAYLFRKRGVWNRFILSEQLTADRGFVPQSSREHWVGRTGVAMTPLRPAGTAEIDGEQLDVVSSGGFIERGTPLRVVAVDGTRIVVKASGRDDPGPEKA